MFDPFKELFKAMKPNKKEANQWWKWAKRIIGYISNSSALALEMMWRRNFGEQYLTNMTGGASIMVFLLLALFVMTGGEGQVLIADRNMAIIFCIVTFVNVGRHRADINQTLQSNIQRHSLDNGVSIFPQILKINEFKAKLIIEPIANIGLVFLLTLLGASLLSTLIMFGGVLAWWKEKQLQRNKYKAYVGMVNSRIQGQQAANLNNVGWQKFHQQKNNQPKNTANSQSASNRSLMARNSKRR